MQNNSQALIDQIQAEWDLVIESFRLAEKQHHSNLKALILKYVPIPNSFEEACNESRKDLFFITSNDHVRDYLDDTNVLENMLSMHINYLEYTDEQ
jgi:hypothetical protein